MKKTITGYIGKSWAERGFIFQIDRYDRIDMIETCDMKTTKGVKTNWAKKDYPPIKVKITIEEI